MDEVVALFILTICLPGLKKEELFSCKLSVSSSNVMEGRAVRFLNTFFLIQWMDDHPLETNACY